MASTFPTYPGLELPITREPLWLTLMQESLSGVQTPQSPWTYPRYRWMLSFSFFRQATAYAEIQSIMGFYNSMYGRGLAFLYNDPNDSTSSTDQLLGVADGTTATTFQLLRTRGSFIEPVFGFSTTSTTQIVNVKVGSTIQSTAAYTISNKGLLTFSSTAPPATGQNVQWNGSFMFYCRFDADEVPFEQFTASSDRQGPLWAGKLAFTSIKFGA